MARRSQWSIADRERIARFADGHSAYAASRRYGVHESTIKAWRAKLRNGEAFRPGLPDVMEALHDSRGR